MRHTLLTSLLLSALSAFADDNTPDEQSVLDGISCSSEISECGDLLSATPGWEYGTMDPAYDHICDELDRVCETKLKAHFTPERLEKLRAEVAFENQSPRGGRIYSLCHHTMLPIVKYFVEAGLELNKDPGVLYYLSGWDSPNVRKYLVAQGARDLTNK
jgi:hypothetical protein